MELEPELLEQFKLVKLHPLIQRRALMYGIALAASEQMSDEERNHDTAHAEMLAATRRQFSEALVEKGLTPSDAAKVMDYVDGQQSEAKKLVTELATGLVALARTSERRTRLPVHLQTHQHFGTEPRWRSGVREFIGEASDDYLQMMRAIDPQNATKGDIVIGEVNRNDLVLAYKGSTAEDDAKRMKEVLNALKKEFNLPGLFASSSAGPASRGLVTDAHATVEGELLRAAIAVYQEQPEKFREVVQGVSRPGRSVA